MFRSPMRELIDKYPARYRGRSVKLTLPPDDVDAIATAYRIGLAMAVVSRASNSHQMEAALGYIFKATREEVWFWASKLLGILGNGTSAEAVLQALCWLSGATDLPEAPSACSSALQAHRTRNREHS